MASRGRPKLRDDEELLAAAVRAFARHGYDAVSLRELSVSLGLSHSALGQRFGAKIDLYHASVTAEFDRFLAEVTRVRSAWPEELSDLEELRVQIYSFLSTSAKFPALGQLMNHEGAESSDRLDFIVTTVVRPQIARMSETLERLVHRGDIRPITTRALFFLVAHGAEAPFTLRALSGAFDDVDGPLEVHAHVELATDLVMRSLGVERPVSESSSRVVAARDGEC